MKETSEKSKKDLNENFIFTRQPSKLFSYEYNGYLILNEVYASNVHFNKSNFDNKFQKIIFYYSDFQGECYCWNKRLVLNLLEKYKKLLLRQLENFKESRK